MTPAETLAKEQARAKREVLELAMLQQIQAVGLDREFAVSRQHRFHPARRWALDFAFPDALVGIECDGGTWSSGRHTRGAGYAADCEKVNEAIVLGWHVLRVTGDQIKSGAAIGWLERVLRGGL